MEPDQASNPREGEGDPHQQDAVSPATDDNTSHPESIATVPTTASERSRPRPIRRSSTLPTQHHRFDGDAGPSGPSRRRGRSVSYRDLEKPPIANRPSMSKEERIPDIPEEVGRTSSRQRDDTSSRGSQRRRKNDSASRPRASTLARRPTMLGNVPPSGFTLAGPAEPAPQTNQPYVDPGYAQLNPAYEQPTNARPVWGLAKPLPRVVRPGMVPTPGTTTPTEPDKPPIDPDIEKGRVDQTLNLGRISSHLRDAREQRENNFLERMGSRMSTSGAALPITRTESRTSSRRRESSVVDPPQPPLTPLPENPTTPGLDEPQAFPFPTDDRPSLVAKDEDNFVPHDNRFPDDASSAATEFDDGPDWVDEDLALMPIRSAEEIHNHHTHWSVIRTRYREELAELLAVIVQLTLGFCADLASTTSGGVSGDALAANLSWGLASMIGIYVAGGISGAHLNPAISIMLWIYRGFPLRKVPPYVFVQVLGAFIAALIAFGVYKSQIIKFGGADLAVSGTANAFVTGPRNSDVGVGTAFFTEFVATSILAVAVLALGDDTNAPPGAGMSAFIMGLVITVESNAFSNNTGCAMNPSRDFGPRLALLALGYGNAGFTSGYWLYGPWAATISGAIVGGALYDIAIFVGGESPINYPRSRIKRAHVKWRRKWATRLRLDKVRRRKAGQAQEKA
ncbi:aquaporin-like protein [Diplodia corticola]|uniref:Aquaporin-like protein n=1 Tax=Diplodia corticola TaxID=236234 RepID=A0A1J9QZ95_9PEZI|nr:aquaporin-like protein [Diplodia corticola]OJD33720.1 aquaporin-like protein [Diplodia corticola]